MYYRMHYDRRKTFLFSLHLHWNGKACTHSALTIISYPLTVQKLDTVLWGICWMLAAATLSMWTARIQLDSGLPNNTS